MTREKKYCTNCNSPLTLKAKFCPECGTKIEGVEETQIINTAEIKEELEKQEDISYEVVEKSEPISEPAINPIEKKETIVIDEEVRLRKENKKLKIKKFIYPILSCFFTFALCLGAFALFYKYYLENLVIETTKREVTVTDTGISEAVNKVYDAVVVVESYYRGQLYSTGTGFVYKTSDDKGYILTNNHVIENADEVKVVFTNDTKETVEIVGTDSYSDVALLSVDKDKIIAVAEIGSSEALNVGDTAFAVGAPLDSSTYAWTVTRGIISGKDRTVEVSSTSGYTSTIMEVLQTDTAINSGNSGGPLCNSNGEVIGITNMKLASSSIEGMGFAIPIETAVEVAEKFISGENVSYPYIGVYIYDATASRYSTEIIGVYVESVEKNSPAEKGGLKSGDKIISVNGKEISSTTYFKHELYKYDVGDEITIKVERNGKEKELTITLGSSNPSA